MTLFKESKDVIFAEINNVIITLTCIFKTKFQKNLDFDFDF